jgi:hypothetical protein
MDSTLVAALIPILIIVLGLKLFCLYDLTRSTVRYLPKWGWLPVLLIGGVVTDVLYLVVGREPK